MTLPDPHRPPLPLWLRTALYANASHYLSPRDPGRSTSSRKVRR